MKQLRQKIHLLSVIIIFVYSTFHSATLDEKKNWKTLNTSTLHKITDLHVTAEMNFDLLSLPTSFHTHIIQQHVILPTQYKCTNLLL